jgi:fumarate reductase subunit C
MVYIAMALAILLAVLALRSLIAIIVVTAGKGTWNGQLGFLVNALVVAVCVAGAVWLFSVAA